MGRVFELIHGIVGDVLKLGEDNARLCPLTVFAEGDFADNCMEGMVVHIGSELHLIQSFCTLDSLRQHLARRIAERWAGPSHRVKPLALGDLFILLQQVERA